MPGALIERPKMTRSMYQALKRHIMQEREKKKQEQEQDEALERMKKERELRKKKEEEDSLTLEQTKEQISQLEKKLESLKQEKHELFSQLKKVLHQEDESRKRAQLKDQTELTQHYAQQYAQSGMPVQGHPILMPGGMSRTGKYLTLHQPMVPVGLGGKRAKYYQQQHEQQAVEQPSVAPMMSPSLKRPRTSSPPPPTATMYPAYTTSGSKYPPASYAPTTVKQEPYVTSVKQEPYTAQKQGNFPSQSTPVTYVTQSYPTPPQQQQQQQQPTSTPYSASQSPESSKYPPANQSAFTSYPNHYAHQQKQITEHFPSGYPPQVQRLPTPHGQPAYLGSPHTTSGLPLQQQLEHANQKSGFNEEKFKIQQQQIRGMAPLPAGQQQIIASQMPPMSQHQPQGAAPAAIPPKGSITKGYPVRSQATTSSYQPTSSQGIYSQQGAPVRHSFPGQQSGRYPY